VNFAHALRCLRGVAKREALRFINQRSRFLSALVRPLVWLFIFAAGFRSVLGVSIIPPYETYILYEEYITPGLLGMILLFNGMQSSLSMVYDREMGSMRVLLTSPLPRWYLLLCKCAVVCRSASWCTGIVVVITDKATGKFCRSDELCHLSHVFRIFCVVSTLENS